MKGLMTLTNMSAIDLEKLLKLIDREIADLRVRALYESEPHAEYWADFWVDLRVKITTQIEEHEKRPDK